MHKLTLHSQIKSPSYISTRRSPEIQCFVDDKQACISLTKKLKLLNFDWLIIVFLDAVLKFIKNNQIVYEQRS
jgi:hypothetical protein